MYENVEIGEKIIIIKATRTTGNVIAVRGKKQFSFSSDGVIVFENEKFSPRLTQSEINCNICTMSLIVLNSQPYKT